MAVDIGKEATDRASYHAPAYTMINVAAAAQVAGTLTSIDIWANTNITGLKIGIFYSTNGDVFKCRSAQSIDGTITAGSSVKKATSLAVEIGDLLGCYTGAGNLELTTSGSDNIWRISSDQCTVDSEQTYSVRSGDAISLGGYIEVATTFIPIVMII